MAEKVLPAVLELLGEYRGQLVAHHCTDSRHCVGYGMPDLVIVGRGVLWAEVKPHRGSTLRSRQTTWKHRLLAAAQRYVIWTQADLDSGKVRADLDSIT